MRCRHPVVTGDMSYNGDRRNGVRTIQLATIERNGTTYVDMSATSPLLGVQAIRTKTGIELKAPLGALDIPTRKEIKGSLGMGIRSYCVCFLWGTGSEERYLRCFANMV